jgi:transcriptional repressor NF-X1
MPESKRKFVHNVSSTSTLPYDFFSFSILSPSQLASVYRMETQMVDREPHRSVQLIRRIDTRVPANLLSQASATGSALGKLADLRAPARVSPAAAPASSGPPRANRGWNSVLTTPHGGNPPTAAPSANSLTAQTSPIGSERLSRSTTPSQSLTQPVAVTTATAGSSSDAVPDNWEDDS